MIDGMAGGVKTRLVLVLVCRGGMMYTDIRAMGRRKYEVCLFYLRFVV